MNGHPLSRGIFYPKGSRAPGFVIGHQCVSVLETFPLWETFRSVPLFRTDAHPHVPVRHRTDGRVQVRAQRGSVRLAATSAAGRWSCPCARRRRCSGTSSRSARELVPCRAAASLKRSPRVARARLVRGRADRRLADGRRVQAGRGRAARGAALGGGAKVFAMAAAAEEAAEEAGRCLAFLADRGEAAVELAESRDRGGGRATRGQCVSESRLQRTRA